MASALKNLSQYDESSVPDASKMRFGIAVADWNSEITHALYEGCFATLIKHGALPENIFTLQVPGTFELPFACQKLCEQHIPRMGTASVLYDNYRSKLDAVIALGCVIRGDTDHNQYISHAAAQGLMQLSLKYNRPFLFGVITTYDVQQALDRAGGTHGNKGVEAAVTAIRMASMATNLTA